MPTVLLTREEKQAVLKALSADRDTWREDTVLEGEQQLRCLCAECGHDWDRMSEEEREAFIDDLIHEDR